MPEEKAATGSTPVTPAPTADAPAAGQVTAAAEEKPSGPKIKTRKPKQRACDEKDAKGKLCAGHLKRWYDYPEEIAKEIGRGAEVYRCEFCKTLYRPDPGQLPNSFTLRY